MRLFFLNRADVIVIEDGCVVTGSEAQGGDDYFWQRLESNEGTRYRWKAPTPADRDDSMEKPFAWDADGDVTGLLHSYAQQPTDYICTLAFPNAPTRTRSRTEFKKPNKCALAVKHDVFSSSNKPVDKCVCRILMEKEFQKVWCPGNVCHSMAQTNYSKDFHAGDDFMIRGYNLTDAAKCSWVLEELVKEMHAGDELPLLKIRVGPADTTVALARCLSYDSLPSSPKHGATSVPESLLAADVMKGASMEKLYSEMVQSFEKEMPDKWSPVMLDISSEIKDDSGETIRVCDMCSGKKRMNQGHFADSLMHCKRLKDWHGIERHEWDRESGRWIDVPADTIDVPISSE